MSNSNPEMEYVSQRRAESAGCSAIGVLALILVLAYACGASAWNAFTKPHHDPPPIHDPDPGH